MPAVLQRVRELMNGEGTSDERGISPFLTANVTYAMFSNTANEGHSIPSPFNLGGTELLLLRIESLFFSMLSEAAFSEDWDSDADSIHECLLLLRRFSV
mgnify:CR=1 FL=1